MNDLIRIRKTPLSGAESRTPRQNRKIFDWRLMTALLILLLIISGSVWFAYQRSKPWRAVFLTNNQVYFGHFLWLPFFSAVSLSDIYYLQAAQPLQPQGQNQAQPEFKIVKFGSEIHGPVDKMMITKKHIIFWENLRDDSPVVKKIQESKGVGRSP